MKKIVIALIAFMVVFTGFALGNSKNSVDAMTDESARVKSDNSSEIEESDIDSTLTKVEAKSLKSSGANQDLLDEFNILEDDEYDFSKIDYKYAETAVNPIIESLINETYFQEELNPDYSYTYNYTNLNNDEFADALVLLGGKEFAGSGGSTVLIFKGEEGDKFSLINKVNLARTPIVVTNDMSNGYRDLIFVVYGGGAKTSYNIMKFDGLKYPLNPSIQLEAQKGSSFEGEALISNHEYYKNLIPASSIK